MRLALTIACLVIFVTNIVIVELAGGLFAFFYGGFWTLAIMFLLHCNFREGS